MTRATMRAIWGAVLCFSIASVVWLVLAVREAKQMARDDILRAGLSHLAAAVELYRDDHDRYPSSLEELLSGLKPEMKQYIEQNRILHDSFNDKYEYRPLSNGFLIAVTAPDAWFAKGSRLEKRFKPGDALK